MVNVLREMDLL